MITLKTQPQTLDECLDRHPSNPPTRVSPVISEDKDHIEGILMAKDLLPFMRSDAREAFSMGKVLRAGGCRPGKQAGRPHAERVSLTARHMAIVDDGIPAASGR